MGKHREEPEVDPPAEDERDWVNPGPVAEDDQADAWVGPSALDDVVTTDEDW